MTECVEHTQGKGAQSYGTVYHLGKTHYMHRLVYCKHNNVTLEDLKGLVVRHTCDNKRCINPEHLLIGTYGDNYRDAQERGLLNIVRGEQCSYAKLKQSDVDYIRQHYTARDRDYGARALARKFGIAHSTVVRIVGGERWTT